MYEYNLGIRFQTIAGEHAEQTAIWFNEQQTINYDELNKLANQVARWLLELGISAGNVVCLSGEKAIYTFAAMIACLKIGAIYAVLDPHSPAERLRKIITTCKPGLLLAEQSLLSSLAGVIGELGIVTVDTDSGKLETVVAGHADTNLVQTEGLTATNPAYLMFTSGSTGFPKGAVMTHGNVMNLTEWSKQTFQITPADILTNVNPLYFDNSVFDFYSALFNGAGLVPFSRDETKDPRLLTQKLDAAQCTLWFSVPSLLIFLQTMKAADGKRLRSIRRFIFGGEGYPKAKLKGLYDAYSDRSELFNVYGPTECTCICSSYKLSERDFDDLQGLPPLGSIANNFSFMILDDENKAVAPGETGELVLLGPNVGKGYYNDSARTAASFVQNPYNSSFPEVMYKTGDLVRFDPADGKLYIQGRKDNQIKHMGYRIELEEIEAALNCLDYVSEAAVLHTSVNGLSRIIAIVAGEEFDGDRIRVELRQIIPEYMIPSVFHHETMLPKNPNGKVDRRHLAEKYLTPDAVKGKVAL
jgi:D-alanine--poly(phosphoribitol) ligase subunit 1